MNILNLLQGDGIEPKYKASTKGGEYGSCCPLCGGRDRLIIQPNQCEGGRWRCRQCGRGGDTIQYLRDVRKMGFRETCQYVGRETSSFSSSLLGKRTKASSKTPKPDWVPRETIAPHNLWQKLAGSLVEDCEGCLLQSFPFGRKMLGWLKECRGLSEETIKSFRLGLVPIDRWENHEQWGLDSVLKGDGTAKKLWFPKGLTIPLCHGDHILRVRIRRPKSGGDPRYYLVRGSDTRAMVLGTDKPVSVLVESELDALLLHQEAGDLVNVVCLGNAKTGRTRKPLPSCSNAVWFSRRYLLTKSEQLSPGDGGKHTILRRAGGHQSMERTPGDMLAADVNIRPWIKAGLIEYKDVAAQPERLLHLAGAEEKPIIDEHHETAPPSTPVIFPAVPATTSLDVLENKLTCFDCLMHEHDPINSPEGWGRCLKRNTGAKLINPALHTQGAGGPYPAGRNRRGHRDS